MTDLSRTLSLEDLVSLVTTGQEVAGTIDHEALLTKILETAGRLTESPDASIILHDPRRDSLYFAHAIGSKAAFLLAEFGEQATKQVPWDSKAGEVFHKRKTEVKLALEDDPSHFKGVDEATRKKTESMITVPLIAAQECIGVMQVLNKSHGDYKARDQLLLEQFAGQAALALRNAELIGDLLAHMGLYSKGRNKRNAQDLVKLLSTPPHSENMTVMFADLRGFRALAQRSTSQKLTKMLNQFLSMLVDQVLSNDGVVNKYLGDGVLAFFRNNNHEVSAVNCAFGMVDAFVPIKELWILESNADISFVDIGIGVCTDDDVIIGPVGSERVKDFSVIGNVVNLAAAFEYEARGGKHVLVNQATYHKVQGLYTADPPVHYELRQPDQPNALSYKQYNLHRKQSAGPPPSICFISFSSADQAFVDERVLKVLKEKGIGWWIASESIEPGEQWLDAITKGLTDADRVLVIVSQNSAKADWVKKEVHVAMTLPHLRGRIIPVCIDETPPKDVDLFLTSIEAIDYKELADLDEQFSRIFDVSRSSPR